SLTMITCIAAPSLPAARSLRYSHRTVSPRENLSDAKPEGLPVPDPLWFSVPVPGAGGLCYEWLMARGQGGEQAPAPGAGEGVARRPGELLMPVPLLRAPGGAGGPDASESLTTVLVAFGANVLVAVAKSAAALVTGSASLVAEAAHSWADSGNEIFLLIAN